MDKTNKTAGWRKYSSIITAIILLLITTLAIAALAYLNAKSAAKNAEQINASARLSTYAQNIKNNVYNVDLYAKQITLLTLQNPRDKEEQLIPLMQNLINEQNSLASASQAFDATLSTFIDGGSLTNESGNIIQIDALSSEDNIKILRAIEEVWQPYLRLMGSFRSSLENDHLNTEAINYATDYARIFNDRISALSEKITDNLSRAANQQSRIAQIYLIVGFLIASLITAYLIFIAFRQLVGADRALLSSQRELNDIMDTITEGLFLVDKQYTIGEQHSAELENILQTKNIANRQFTDLLRGRVSDKDLDLTEGFLEQLFNRKVYSELVDALNPLSRVHIVAEEGSDKKKDIYLSFSFHRVYEGKKIKYILVSVRDVTENVLLEKRLEQERLDNEAKLEMLSTILQVDAHLMNDFLQHVSNGAGKVNAILRGAGSQASVLIGKIREIGRIMHSLKGESSALNLTSFTRKIEDIETDLQTIKNKEKIVGNDFLGLTIRLDELLTMNEKARELFERVATGKLSAADIEETPGSAVRRYLARFAEQVSKRNQDKQIDLTCMGLDNDGLTDAQKSDLRELSLQFMRNAIVHGIETPQARREAGKPEKGQIDIRLDATDDGFWRYSFRDDGNGIDFDTLRAKASLDDMYIQRDPDSLTRKELIRYMFKSGISTAEHNSEDAGRGVGMDVIREITIRLGGKIQIHSESGTYTHFIIKFPKEMNGR